MVNNLEILKRYTCFIVYLFVLTFIVLNLFNFFLTQIIEYKKYNEFCLSPALNIFSKTWDAICNFFSKIGEALSNIHLS